MEKPNPTGLPLTWEAGDTSPALQPRCIGESPPRTEQGEKDQLVGQAPSWEVQWLAFLERVRSQEGLEEAVMWQEAKVLLAVLKAVTGACGCPGDEWVKLRGVPQTLAVLPLELQGCLIERGLHTSSQAVSLAEAFSWSQQESRRLEEQVAAGSSSAVPKNLPDLGQDEDWEVLSYLAPVPDWDPESDQPGMWLERVETETPSSCGNPRGQEGNPPEETMDQLIPRVGGAFQELAIHQEESVDQYCGSHRSPRAEEEPEQEGVAESFTSFGTPGPEGKRFLCWQCGKWFSQCSDLVEHRKTHTRLKNHRCCDCGKRFVFCNYRRMHEKIHTRLKYYMCCECGRRFSMRSPRVAPKLTHRQETLSMSPYGQCFALSYSLTCCKKRNTCPHCCYYLL